MSGTGLAIVGVILFVLFFIVAVLFPASTEYDPHSDPTFMQYHEPMYCPVCKARRESGRH